MEEDKVWRFISKVHVFGGGICLICLAILGEQRWILPVAIISGVVYAIRDCWRNMTVNYDQMSQKLLNLFVEQNDAGEISEEEMESRMDQVHVAGPTEMQRLYNKYVKHRGLV